MYDKIKNEAANAAHQAKEMIAQQAKKAAKETAKQIGNAIRSAIAPAIPYILIVALVVLIIVAFIDWNNVGITAATNTSATGWWWPIGSVETTEVNGKLFASGTPALGKNNISRMGKDGKAYGIEIDSHADSRNSYALDIGAGGVTNKYYVISIGSGTVEKVADGIPEGRDPDANYGRGNYVLVNYGEIKVYYVHLYAGSIQVEQGDTVEYGQVIGKVGHNGDSTGPHLHLEIQKDGICVDATEYVDPDNPRPTEEIVYNNVDTSLTDYLLNFGGEGTIYEISGRQFYHSYDDTVGNLTVGLDVYIGGHRAGFSVPGWVSDTAEGPAKQVDNVYNYVINKFNSGICVYIEKELSDSCAATLRDSKWQNVLNLEASLGTTFSQQQRYALCAIYYRGVSTIDVFKTVWRQAESSYGKDTWKFNKYLWENWYCQQTSIYPNAGGFVKALDAQFETFVKGVTQWEEINCYSRKNMKYFTVDEINTYWTCGTQGLTYTRSSSNEEDIFTTVMNTALDE